MASQQDYTLKSLSLAPGFQFKLSELLSNSPSSYVIQSDCVVMTMREGSFVDLYFCDSALTRIQNYLAIEGVTSLSNISIKYNSNEGQIALVYKTQGALTFYRGKIPTQGDSKYRSTLVTSDSAVLPIDKKQQIIGISEIYYAKTIGSHCLITSVTGQISLLQFNQVKTKLSLMSIQNGFQRKFSGIFKSIIKPFISIRNFSYRKCQTFLYPFDKPENLYSLTLLDKHLQIKYYNLKGKQPYQFDNSCQELANWQMSLSQDIGGSTQILESLFVNNNNRNHANQISLLALCLNGQVIDYYQIIIDLTGQVTKTSVISDIFKFKYKNINSGLIHELINVSNNENGNENNNQNHNENSNSNNNSNANGSEMDEQISYNSNTDFVQLKSFDNKIFAVYHKQVAYRKKKHTIVILNKLGNKNKIAINPVTLNLNQQIRIVKLEKPQSLQQNNQMDQQQQPRLLIIGESACYQFTKEDDTSKEDSLNQNQVQNQNMLGTNKRVIPPIPSYDQPRNTYETKSQRNNKSLNMSKQSAKQFQNPFSKLKVQKYINRKDFLQLFNLLNLKKDKFNEQVQTKRPNPDKFSQQLLILVLLKLFTYQEGLKYQTNNDLIKQIFNENLQNKYFNNSQQNYHKFLKDLFIESDIQCLRLLFQIFLTNRHYTRLYQVCTDVIPKYLQYLEASVFKSGNQNMQAQNKEADLQTIKDYIIQNYLNFYEKLLFQLSEHYMETQSIQPHQANLKKTKSGSSNKQTIVYRSFSQFQHKELFDKYLLIKSMTKQVQNQNNQTMIELLELYLRKGEKFKKFLTNIAIKHKSLPLFDFLLLRRMVSKQNVKKFVQQLSPQQSNQIVRLFINLLKTQIETIQNAKNVNSIYDDKNLSVLLWIPAELIDYIYEYLMDNYTKVGVVYGIMHKKRVKVAQDLESKMEIFEVSDNPKNLLGVLQPLYKVTKNLVIKLNIDLLRLFAKAEISKFVSAKKFQKGYKSTQIKISNKRWQQFCDRVNKYSTQEIKAILNKIVTEQLITIT